MPNGLMDGWHGDEMECHGICGLCSKCEYAADRKADDDYDRFVYEENEE